MSTAQQVSLIVSFLRQATSLRVVSEFLRSRGLPHSVGSWDDLAKDRILPAINAGKLTIDDLYGLLAEVEDFGRSHVFVFKCKPELAQELLKSARVEATALAHGVAEQITKPLHTALPKKPTVTGIRIEEGDGASLSIKVVETRQFQRLLREKVRGDRTYFVYETAYARAVM